MTHLPKPPLFNPTRVNPNLTNMDQYRAIAASPSKGPDLSKPGLAFTGNPRDPGREEPARWERARAHPSQPAD